MLQPFFVERNRETRRDAPMATGYYNSILLYDRKLIFPGEIFGRFTLRFQNALLYNRVDNWDGSILAFNSTVCKYFIPACNSFPRK